MERHEKKHIRLCGTLSKLPVSEGKALEARRLNTNHRGSRIEVGGYQHAFRVKVNVPHTVNMILFR